MLYHCNVPDQVKISLCYAAGTDIFCVPGVPCLYSVWEQPTATPDHIYLLLSIPPKFSVANTVGFIKGKSAIRIHRPILGTKRMTGLCFCATGYCVSTVGLDEEKIKKYI